MQLCQTFSVMQINGFGFWLVGCGDGFFFVCLFCFFVKVIIPAI